MAPQREDEQNFVDLPFPIHGLDVSRAFGLQTPGTTPIGLNVRAFDPLTARARGGQRPGLSKYGPSLFSASLIQELLCVVGVGYAAPAPSSGPSIAQSGASASGTGTTIVNSFSSPLTTGNAVLVIAGSTDGSRGFPNSVSDGTNSFTRIDTSSVSNTALSYWLATGITGGASSITTTWNSGSGTVQCIAFEVNGVSAADHGSEPTGVGTSGTGTDFTTTTSPTIIFVAVQANHPVARTAGNYFDLVTGQNLYVGFKFAARVVTTGADFTFSISPSSFWAGIEKALR